MRGLGLILLVFCGELLCEGLFDRGSGFRSRVRRPRDVDHTPEAYSFYDLSFTRLSTEADCKEGRIYYKDVNNNATNIADLIFGYECISEEGKNRLVFEACYPDSKDTPVINRYSPFGAYKGPQYRCEQDTLELLGVVGAADDRIVAPNTIENIHGSLWETVYKNGRWRVQMIAKTCSDHDINKAATRFDFDCANDTMPVMKECTDRGDGMSNGQTRLTDDYETSCDQKGDEMCFYRSKCVHENTTFAIGETLNITGSYSYRCIHENGMASRVYVNTAKNINETSEGSNEELGVVVSGQEVTGCWNNGRTYLAGESLDKNGILHNCEVARNGQPRLHAQKCAIGERVGHMTPEEMPDGSVENAPNACEIVENTATPVYKDSDQCRFGTSDETLLALSTSVRGEKVAIDATIGQVSYRKEFVCAQSSQRYYYFKPRGCILDDVLIPIFEAEQSRVDGKYYECRLNGQGHPTLLPGLDYHCTFKNTVFKHLDEEGNIAYVQDEATGTGYGCDFGRLAKKFCFDRESLASFWPGVTHSYETRETRICQAHGEGYFVSSYTGCFIGDEVRPFGGSYVVGDLLYKCELQSAKAEMCEEQPRATVCGCSDDGALKGLYTLYDKECSSPGCESGCRMCTDKGIEECTPRARDCWHKYGTTNCQLCDTCGNATSTLPPPRVTKATTPLPCLCDDKLPFCDTMKDYCDESIDDLPRSECAKEADVNATVAFTRRMCAKTCGLCGSDGESTPQPTPVSTETDEKTSSASSTIEPQCTVEIKTSEAACDIAWTPTPLNFTCDQSTIFPDTKIAGRYHCLPEQRMFSTNNNPFILPETNITITTLIYTGLQCNGDTMTSLDTGAVTNDLEFTCMNISKPYPTACPDPALFNCSHENIECNNNAIEYTIFQRPHEEHFETGYVCSYPEYQYLTIKVNGTMHSVKRLFCVHDEKYYSDEVEKEKGWNAKTNNGKMMFLGSNSFEITCFRSPIN